MLNLWLRFSEGKRVRLSYLDSFREDEESGEDEEEPVNEARQNLRSHVPETQRGHTLIKQTARRSDPAGAARRDGGGSHP